MIMTLVMPDTDFKIRKLQVRICQIQVTTKLTV